MKFQKMEVKTWLLKNSLSVTLLKIASIGVVIGLTIHFAPKIDISKHSATTTKIGDIYYVFNGDPRVLIGDNGILNVEYTAKNTMTGDTVKVSYASEPTILNNLK